MADNSGISSTNQELLLEFDGNYDDSSTNNRDMSSWAGAEFYTSDGAVEGTQAAKFSPAAQNFINTELVDIGSASFFAGVGEAWTVAGFVRFAGESSGGSGALFSKWKGDGSDPFTKGSATFLLTLDTNAGNGNMTVRLRGSTNSYAVDLNDGEWHAVVVTWDGTTAKVYFDGTALTNANVGSQAENTLIGCWIGAYPNYANTLSGAFNGQMDDFRVYSRAWNASEAELFWIYGPGEAGGGDVQLEDLELRLDFEDDLLDSSVNLRHQTGNLVNGPLTFVAGKVTGKASDWTASSSQHIATGVTSFGNCTLFSDASNSFTVSGWVKNDDAGGGIGMVVSRQMGTSPGPGFRLRITNGGAEVYLRGQLNSYTLTGNDDGEWHHYVVTWDGSTTTAAFYYDGAAQSAPTNGSVAEGSCNIYIGTTPSVGCASSLSLFFDEHLDDLRFYSRALSASDVTDLFDNSDTTKFSTTLVLDSIDSNDVATVQVTFGEDIDASTFVIGDISVTNGTASNLSQVSASVFTFDVTPTAAGTVTALIAVNKVQNDDGANNAASNTLAWGSAGGGGAGGILSFDRTADDSSRTAEILIGPIPISDNAAVKSMLQRVQNVFGRNSDATGTVKFYAGADAQDSIERAEADAPQYSISLANLISAGGACYPRLAGHAMTIGIEVTGDHLTFEQSTFELMPMKGRNRMIRHSS